MGRVVMELESPKGAPIREEIAKQSMHSLDTTLPLLLTNLPQSSDSLSLNYLYGPISSHGRLGQNWEILTSR